MTWTYDPTEPTAKDRVRSRIGDTDDLNPANQLITDEVINAQLALMGEVQAAIVCLDRILAKVSTETDRSAIGISGQRSQRTNHLENLRLKLIEERDRTAMPYSGGLSKAEKQSDEADPDLVTPSFDVGRDDLPGGTIPLPPVTGVEV